MSVSRASQDARIYTNDAGTLVERLSTDISKASAVEVSRPNNETQTRQHWIMNVRSKGVFVT